MLSSTVLRLSLASPLRLERDEDRRPTKAKQAEKDKKNDHQPLPQIEPVPPAVTPTVVPVPDSAEAVLVAAPAAVEPLPAPVPQAPVVAPFVAPPAAVAIANSGLVGVTVAEVGSSAKATASPPSSTPSLPASTIGAISVSVFAVVAIAGIAVYKRRQQCSDSLNVTTSVVHEDFIEEQDKEDVPQPLPKLEGLRRKRTISQIFNFEKRASFVPPTYLNADGMEEKDGVVVEFADTIKEIYEQVA
ncbi:hypothetical protein BDR26DRAFT_872496 [Obelidium mucronatum]|nr:hypothetical protein BDR26DRAFT_872496 [Obelidium mucronatum]